MEPFTDLVSYVVSYTRFRLVDVPVVCPSRRGGGPVRACGLARVGVIPRPESNTFHEVPVGPPESFSVDPVHPGTFLQGVSALFLCVFIFCPGGVCPTHHVALPFVHCTCHFGLFVFV